MQIYSISGETPAHKIWIPERISEGVYVFRNKNSDLYIAFKPDTRDINLIQDVYANRIEVALVSTDIFDGPMVMMQAEYLEGEMELFADEVELELIPLTRGDLLLVMY